MSQNRDSSASSGQAMGHPAMPELLPRIESQHEAVERPGGRLLLRTRFRRHKAGNAVIDDQLSGSVLLNAR